MKKNILIAVSIFTSIFGSFGQIASKVKEFNNSNHPQIAYWFLTGESLENNRYLNDLDGMLKDSKQDFFFLDGRHGARFNDIKQMHKVLLK